MRPGILTPLQVLWKRSRLERGCRFTLAQLEAHQSRKLAELRRFATERSRFYARFHKGLENKPLSELPILTKAAMMESFDDLVTDPAIKLADADEWLKHRAGGDLFRGRYIALSTSGSTGRRGVFLFSRSEWITALANIARSMAWAGVNGSLGGRPPKSAMIASRTPWHYSARVTESLSNRLLPALHLDAGEPVESIVDRLNAWQPEVLAGYPSIIRQLAEEQIARRLNIKLRSIATSAEVLTDETRRRAHRAWGVRVYDTYGATEYAPIAAECRHDSKHLVEDGAIIEIVDDRGRAVPPGERGERVLLTVFDRATQPLIRYELGDVLRPRAGTCECGRAFRMVESIEGRAEEVLEIGTVSVHPNLFHEVLETVPASGWQVVQEPSGLKVNLAGLRDASLCETLRAQLSDMLSRQGAKLPEIRVLSVEALERGATGKAPLVTSRVHK
jgi:putative adenylate-forming enzyme